MADGLKSFTFASKRIGLTSVEVIESFEIDGEEFHIRALKDSAVAMLVHKTQGGNASGAVVISAVLDFAERALLPESARRFEDLILGTDGGDGLDMVQIVEVFNHILSVVAANPSGSRTASSAASRKTGSGSRAASRAKAPQTL